MEVTRLSSQIAYSEDRRYGSVAVLIAVEFAKGIAGGIGGFAGCVLRRARNPIDQALIGQILVAREAA